MKVNKILKPVKRFILDNSSQILTGLEIAGYFTAGIMAVKATPKAYQALEDKKYDERMDKLTVWETIRTAGPYYIPAGIVAAGATGAAIGRCIKDQRKQAFLATAVSAAEATNRELLEKTKEIVGEETVKEIQEKIVEDRLSEPINESDIAVTGYGTDLFYEYETGRLFYCDKEVILKAKDKLNDRLFSENYITLNEFYAEIGLETTGFGSTHEWTSETGSIRIDLEDARVTSNGKLAYVLNYDGRLRHKKNSRW